MVMFPAATVRLAGPSWGGTGLWGFRPESGLASGEITGWWVGRMELRPASTACCQPRELMLAASSLLSVSSSTSARFTWGKHVFICFKVQFHSTGHFRGHVTLAGMQPTLALNDTLKSGLAILHSHNFPPLIFSAISCLQFLSPPSGASPLTHSSISLCALITSPNWQ